MQHGVLSLQLMLDKMRLGLNPQNICRQIEISIFEEAYCLKVSIAKGIASGRRAQNPRGNLLVGKALEKETGEKNLDFRKDF